MGLMRVMNKKNPAFKGTEIAIKSTKGLSLYDLVCICEMTGVSFDLTPTSDRGNKMWIKYE